MQTTPKIREIYKQIQEKLFYMIPEKWEKVYLYASIIDGINNIETGEMFFYYFPKGIFKKDPINVYEVPSKYNIDEAIYFKLAENLYNLIKKLRKEYISEKEKLWSSITISVENNKFIVEYDYENLKKSTYNNYDRHLIWKYMYLNSGINTFNKKERKIILEYMRDKEQIKKEKVQYIEGIYANLTNNIVDYDRKESKEENEFVTNEEVVTQEFRNQLLKYKKID